MPGLRSTVALALVELEVTYGVDPTPTVADAFLCENFLPPETTVDVHERPGLTSFPINEPHVTGKHKQEFTFDVEMKGSGTVDVPPEWSKLLQASGFLETVNAATSVVWTPDLDDAQSVTIYFYADGKLYIGTGARGSVTINAGAVGERVMQSYTMQALFNPVTDVALPAAAVFDPTEPPVFMGGTFTYGAFAACLRSLSIDLATEMAEHENFTASTGFKEFTHTKFAPTGTMQIEDELVATRPWTANLLADTDAVLNAIFGTGGGNRFTLNAPVVRKEAAPHSEESGINTRDISFRLYDSSGDDFITITHD